jgi:hypothetical protein
MAGQAKVAMGADTLDVLADRGASAAKSWPANPWCHTPCSQAAHFRGQGQESVRKQDFVYVADDDVYRCPAGQTLTIHLGRGRHEPLRLLDDQVRQLSLAQCTTGKERRIKRWEHEAVTMPGLERTPTPCASAEPSSTHSAHSCTDGATHQDPDFDKVRTEMSLHVWPTI